MRTRPSTKISVSSTKNPNFCTEMISASYSSPRCFSMNCAVFQAINSRSAVSARRSVSEVSDAMASSSTRRYGPSMATVPLCRAARSDSARARGVVGMIERPLQHAMHDQVRIAANRRREMRVLIEGQREMSERVGGVARLLERTQHQVGDDALLGLAGDFFGEALVVLRANVHFIRGGQ